MTHKRWPLHYVIMYIVFVLRKKISPSTRGNTFCTKLYLLKYFLLFYQTTKRRSDGNSKNEIRENIRRCFQTPIENVVLHYTKRCLFSSARWFLSSSRILAVYKTQRYPSPRALLPCLRRRSKLPSMPS